MISKWRSDEFLRHNAVFFVGSLAVGFLNYLFYPVLGRLLAPIYFGEVQTLFTLLSHIGAFLSVLGLVTVNILANQKDKKVAQTLISELEKLATLIALACFVFLVIGVHPVAKLFNFTSVYPFIIFGLAVLVGVPSTFRRSTLQGIKDFAGLSWIGIDGAFFKLFLSVIFVMLGYKTGGIMTAILITQVFVFFHILLRLRKNNTDYAWSKQFISFPNIRLIKPELAYAGLVLSVSLIITIQYSIDILAVKHYFPPAQAGAYAGISAIANTIFFITGSISAVLLASVKIDHFNNSKLLKRSLKMLSLIGGFTLLIFALFPNLVISALLGGKYTAASHYLPSISLAMFLVSLANLLYIYYLAQRDYIISIFAVGGLATTVVLMLAYHHTIQAIINNIIIGSLILLMLITFYGGVKHKISYK